MSDKARTEAERLWPPLRQPFEIVEEYAVDAGLTNLRSTFVQGAEWALSFIDRDELRDVLSGWPIGSGYYQTTVGTDEAREMADAVIAFLRGEGDTDGN